MIRLCLGVLAGFVAVAPTAAVGQEPAPATVAELRDCVDWGKVPRLLGANGVRHRFTSSTYTAPGTYLAAATFFRQALPGVGWTADEEPTPGADQKDYLYVAFHKGSMRMAVNGYRPEPTAPMTVTLSLGGNVDARKFPRPADAVVTNEQRAVVMYTTAAGPEEAARACGKGVAGQGWTEVPEATAKFHAKEGRIVLRFLKNAMEVGVVAHRGTDGRTQVTCHTSVRNTFPPEDVRVALTTKDIPTPPKVSDYLAVLDLRAFPLMADARKQDRQTKPMASSAGVSYQVPATLEAVLGFHRKEFAARGWVETTADTDIPDRATITFEKEGYLVTVGAYRPEGKKDTEVGITNHGNVDPRQLPYPPGAEIPAERDTFVNTSVALAENETVAFYRTELAKLGWREVEKVRGRKSYEFVRNAAVLRVEIAADSEGRTGIKLHPMLLGVE